MVLSRCVLAAVVTACGFSFSLARAQTPPNPKYAFSGSKACETCHKEIYDRWKNTLMANILVDPKQHPEVIVGDFSQPNPLVTFTQDDVAFTYGSKWKQRYFTRVGDDYFVFPAQWDVKNRVWRRYYVEPGADWWAKYYPADAMQRPTGPLCDGCHSTNYNIETKQVTEWNVGCEKCHGPGSAHVNSPSKANIVNPNRLGYVRAADVCIQCHSQGQPIEKPLNGVYYDWPVGYQPGDRLSDFWTLEEHPLGEETFTHWPDGSAHKNRMQGNDFVNSVMYTKGVRCWACHDVHGTSHNALVIKPGNALCLTCHGPESPAGPRGTIEAHTHHAADSAGSECVACHMPQIAKTIADVNVRSHTFRFLSPALTERYKIPNPCLSCHSDRSSEWAAAEMLRWENVSPWRIGR
jgi:predicted CXXCH cytochrome family protein